MKTSPHNVVFPTYELTQTCGIFVFHILYGCSVKMLMRTSIPKQLFCTKIKDNLIIRLSVRRVVGIVGVVVCRRCSSVRARNRFNARARRDNNTAATGSKVSQAPNTSTTPRVFRGSKLCEDVRRRHRPTVLLGSCWMRHNSSEVR